MDRDRVDLLIQYALAVAGQNDFGERELGPIHLLKYVYLGDLAHAGARVLPPLRQSRRRRDYVADPIARTREDPKEDPRTAADGGGGRWRGARCGHDNGPEE